jgi:hypothetical protein
MHYFSMILSHPPIEDEIKGRGCYNTFFPPVQIKKKEEAKADYDAAVNSGVSAFLLEETEGRPDIFQISVGRLPPGSVATILLTYIKQV